MIYKFFVYLQAIFLFNFKRINCHAGNDKVKKYLFEWLKNIYLCVCLLNLKLS